MARLIFGMLQSLDGYVSGPEGGPGLPLPNEALMQHFNERGRALTASLYGRTMYEIMRYWDNDDPDHDEASRVFARDWQGRPKFVVSSTLKSLGKNATLIDGDLEAAVRKLKTEYGGEIDVAGPELAAGLGALGLIDEYQLYLQPVVLGGGRPFFHGARPPLRFKSSERIDEDVVLLTYVPA
jgi:dihydrofolate reductase